MLNKRFKLVIAYDGTNYHGFQAQNDLPTIEKALTDSIYKMTGENIKIFGAGRTDKAVHAKGQVIHFDTTLNIDCNGWLRGLNSYLPIDIRIIDVKQVDENFHSRFSAIKKEYCYYIMLDEFDLFKRNYAMFCQNLDLDKMIMASKELIGKHNFRGFCSVDVNELKDFERTIYDIIVTKKGNLVEFKFIGDGFLKYQIRRMMGLLIEIGLNKKEINFITTVLEKQDPRLSHKVADGCGLFLMEVSY